MALRINRQREFNCRTCRQPMSAGETPALAPVVCPACGKEQIVPALLADLILQERVGPIPAGETFRGMDVPLGRKVDVLVMKNKSGSYAAMADATLRVHKALARLDHPYLQRVHRLLELGEHTVIVTEPRAQSLGSVTRRKQIAPSQLLNLAIQAAHGLEAAAQAGMCHMALRPSCFQLCANLTIHVMGFSPWNHPPLEPPPAGWSTLAPASYLAPEVLRGKRPDGKSDMYAFGTCLLFFLTRQMPDQARTAGEILHQTHDALPRNWSRTLSALLALEPANRPEHWDRVLALLKNRGGDTAIVATHESLEDLRERSTLAHSSLHADDGKGPSGMLEGLMNANVEIDADEMLGQIWSIAGPDDDVDMGEQMAYAKAESPVDIMAKAVMDGDMDASDTAMLRAAQVGEMAA